MIKKIIGRTDKVDLPVFDLENVHAKIDTGATWSSLHCKHVKQEGNTVKFKIKTDHGYKEFWADDWFKCTIRSSNGKAERRYIIKTKLQIFGKIYIVSFSLTDRSKMKYPILIGRKFLKSKYVVDVAQKDLSYKQKIS